MKERWVPRARCSTSSISTSRSGFRSWEALACGTPVIASNRGSMPELIDHGVTGFLVDSVDEAVDAIGRINEIDRAACRAASTARFTVDRMADRYLDLYRSLLG
jgi:glycosyltransferase involved in cell wall biosynthesis